MSLLALVNVQARHGLLQAVRGVSLSLEKGETLALVGANGAGKTTLLRAIAGAHKLSGGSISLGGVDVGAKPSYARAALGIALTPEGRKLFSRMTVEENLLLAKAAGRSGPSTSTPSWRFSPTSKRGAKASRDRCRAASSRRPPSAAP